MYNETCCKCETTGHEMLIDGMCFSCVEKALANYDKLKASHAKLFDLLGELYDYASIEWRGKYILADDEDLQIKTKQALKEAKET